MWEKNVKNLKFIIFTKNGVAKTPYISQCKKQKASPFLTCLSWKFYQPTNFAHDPILSIIKTISNPDSTLPQIVYWLMGSFSKANMNQFWILLPIVVICTIILIIIRWRINLVALGRIVSMSKGLNYTFYKWLLIFIGAMLISASVAVSGNVSWVGLIIPNILTMIFKNDNRKTIIFSIPIGASFMILVDILSRSITPDEIPLSGITGVIGLITIIIFFILKFRKGHKNA